MKKQTVEEFIVKADLVHSGKYGYSKVNYKGNKIKVCIICPVHGEFWQTPDSHLSHHGCKRCFDDNRVINDSNYEKFIVNAIQVHGDKYDYSKVNYKGAHKKIEIICPIHGEFLQTPAKHLIGHGCHKCAKYGQLLETKDVILKSKLVHGDKYDYSKVNYVNINYKVCIVCKEHGEFWQTPHNHLQGQGCPICNESKLERQVAKLLDENNITYERQKHFKWLGRQSLDFYLPLYQIGIECQGRQHFEPVFVFGGDNEFKKIIERDKRKLKLCDDNNIKILFYCYNEKICEISKILNKYDWS